MSKNLPVITQQARNDFDLVCCLPHNSLWGLALNISPTPGPVTSLSETPLSPLAFQLEHLLTDLSPLTQNLTLSPLANPLWKLQVSVQGPVMQYEQRKHLLK